MQVVSLYHKREYLNYYFLLIESIKQSRAKIFLSYTYYRYKSDVILWVLLCRYFHVIILL